MKYHYRIVFPHNPALPIIVMDYYKRENKEVTLAQVKDFVLGAVLRNDLLTSETPTYYGIEQTITITDRQEVLDEAERYNVVATLKEEKKE